MIEPVIISVEGTQHFAGEEKQTVEIITEGTMRRENDMVYLSYEESEVTGMTGTTTTFAVAKDNVTLIRSGAIRSQMVFERSKQNVSLYDVGFGAMKIGIKTRRLQNDLGPDGGRLEISYGIEIEETIRGLNSFIINVRKPGTTPQ